ncbi:MAG: hypothetical protein SGILL_004045 [Bacillariaceae sp.]
MMMFSTRRIAIAALALLAVTAFSSSVDAQQQQNNVVEEIHHSSVPPEGQRRHLTWDFFGFLMMMVSGECGPANHIRLGDHPKCHACFNGNSAKCAELCSMATSDHHKSHYKELFCDASSGSSTTTQYNEASDASSFSGSTTPGGFNTGGAMAKGFQWWMVAAAAAVVMALVAVIMGQKRDGSRGQRSAMSGAVGRRFTAVNAFADGIFPTKKPSAVEMAPAAAGGVAVAAASGDYQLDNDGDDQTAPVDDENASTASPGSEGSEGKDYAMC